MKKSENLNKITKYYFNPEVAARRVCRIVQLSKERYSLFELESAMVDICGLDIAEKILGDQTFWITADLEKKILLALDEKFSIQEFVYIVGKEFFLTDAFEILSSDDTLLDYSAILQRIPILLQRIVRYVNFVTEDSETGITIKIIPWQNYQESIFDLLFIKGLLVGGAILYQINSWKIEVEETIFPKLDPTFFETSPNVIFSSGKTILSMSWEDSNLKVGKTSLKENLPSLDSMTFVISKKEENQETKFSYIDLNAILDKSRELYLANRDLEAAVEVLTSLRNELMVKQKAISKDLKMARNIQKGIIPQTIPDWKGLQFAFRFLPMQEVSGDYYDYFNYGSNKIGIMLSDVSGHGVPAAFITAISKLLFTNYKLDSPSEIFCNTNRELIELVKQQGYLTCFYGIIDSNYELTYCIAGHPRPILMRYDTHEVSILDGEGTFLGMFTDADKYFKDYKIKLNPGDKLFVYTDGFLEGQTDEGEPFQLSNLLKLIEESRDMDMKSTIDYIMVKYNDFCKGTDQSDDITLLGIGLSLLMEEFELLKVNAEKEVLNNNHLKACEYLLQAKSIFPSDVNVLYLLGKYFAKLRQYKEAIINIEEYNALNSSNADARLILGYCYFRLENYARAEMEFLKASSLRGSNTNALYNLAKTYIKQKSLVKAAETLERILNFDPNHIQSKRSLEQVLKAIKKKKS
jgi:serine phosphatase RsbU (regulator of sigma subunit)